MKSAASLASMIPKATAPEPLITACMPCSTGARSLLSIAVTNDRELSYYKDVGLVGEVFDEQKLSELGGTCAVGHVRYATTGAYRREKPPSP